MNIDLSHSGLDARRKKKFILKHIHRVNWTRVSETSEWVWASMESEKEIGSFSQWISEQPIDYPANVILFDSQWHEISKSLSLNEFDIVNLFKMTRTMYLVPNNMKWIVEYSDVQVARFGTMNI
jgi:hypothetical protein